MNQEKNIAVDPSSRLARSLLVLSLILSLLLPVLFAADLFFRTSRQHVAAARWIHRLDLSAPAFWPAGTGLRHPEMMIRAVDERPGPNLAPSWFSGVVESKTGGQGP